MAKTWLKLGDALKTVVWESCDQTLIISQDKDSIFIPLKYARPIMNAIRRYLDKNDKFRVSSNVRDFRPKPKNRKNKALLKNTTMFWDWVKHRVKDENTGYNDISRVVREEFEKAVKEGNIIFLSYDKDVVFTRITDLVSGFLFRDREWDDDLPRGKIGLMIKNKEISVSEIVQKFEEELISGLRDRRV